MLHPFEIAILILAFIGVVALVNAAADAAHSWRVSRRRDKLGRLRRRSTVVL